MDKVYVMISDNYDEDPKVLGVYITAYTAKLAASDYPGCYNLVEVDVGECPDELEPMRTETRYRR